MHPINKPEVLIGVAHTKFDAQGAFTDEVGRGSFATCSLHSSSGPDNSPKVTLVSLRHENRTVHPEEAALRDAACGGSEV